LNKRLIGTTLCLSLAATRSFAEGQGSSGGNGNGIGGSGEVVLIAQIVC
jgi:hypothetical protein